MLASGVTWLTKHKDVAMALAVVVGTVVATARCGVAAGRGFVSASLAHAATPTAAPAAVSPSASAFIAASEVS